VYVFLSEVGLHIYVLVHGVVALFLALFGAMHPVLLGLGDLPLYPFLLFVWFDWREMKPVGLLNGTICAVVLFCRGSGDSLRVFDGCAVRILPLAGFLVFHGAFL